jgi:hypothetical protein
VACAELPLRRGKELLIIAGVSRAEEVMSSSSRLCVLPAILAVLAACATTTSPGDDIGDDDVTEADAAVSQADASEVFFDAMPGQPDAMPGQPDAMPSQPDAAMMGIPDAAPVMVPDAATGPFCASIANCAGGECCFKFPPDAPMGFCVVGEEFLGVCFPAGAADAGPM